MLLAPLYVQALAVKKETKIKNNKKAPALKIEKLLNVSFSWLKIQATINGMEWNGSKINLTIKMTKINK